jgi:hypothetical protein
MQLAVDYYTNEPIYPVAPYLPTPTVPPPTGVTVITGTSAPAPVAPSYNPGYVPAGPGSIISEGFGLSPSPATPPAAPPPAPAGNGVLPNQTYNCGGRCGAQPMPSPGAAAGGATTVTAAGSLVGGVPWWVWLLIAILVVLVLAKR